MIYQIRDVWWVLVHKAGCIFEYLFNHNLLSDQTSPIGKQVQ